MKHCDSCDGTDFETIATHDRHGESLETSVCRTCGLVCHTNIPSEAELAAFYAHEYRKSYHGESTPSARRVDRAWRNGQRILQQVGPHLRPGCRVFEVGAGIGCTVKSFEFAGFQAAGIDPGVGFASYAKQQLRADVGVGDLFELPPQPRCDAVLLVHVIEHFRSPRRALEAIHRLLPEGGRLYVECPNLAAPFARRSQLFHVAHIHNFTPITLTQLAERCGFRVAQNFTVADDPNLQMLFVRAEAGERRVDPEGYRLTWDAVARSASLGYHLRADYLRRRIAKVAAYLGEHLSAKARVAQLLERCVAAEAAKSNGPTVRAA